MVLSTFYRPPLESTRLDLSDGEQFETKIETLQGARQRQLSRQLSRVGGLQVCKFDKELPKRLDGVRWTMPNFFQRWNQMNSSELARDRSEV